MRIVASISLALTLILISLATPAAAHGNSVGVDFPSGERCYIYASGPEHAEAPTFWRETNGDLSGDEEGLQRGTNGDTQYEDPAEWISDCAALG